VVPAKLILAQSTGFKLKHQSPDLFSASSLSLGDFSVFHHAHSPAKKPRHEQVGMV
jgi:hypothetical protein